MENMQSAFGAIQREQSPTDFHLGAFTPSTYPDTFLPTYPVTIENQNHTPSCGAHAGAYVKDIFGTTRVSPEYLWKKIKQVDGFGVDNGTTLDVILQTLQKQGICSFDLLPNNSNVTNAQYADPSTLTPQMDADAQTRKISAYAFQFNPTIDDLKSAIYTHKAVIMQLNVGMEWWTPSWFEADILPLKTIYPVTSGHFVVAYAYDTQYIYFFNEWSDTWGRQGIGYFGLDYLSRCHEIGTIVDTALYTFTKLLKFGMTSTDVGMLQKKLRDLGFFPVAQSVTSYFGSITRTSVIKFQSAHNLTADGIVGPLTNAQLNK